MKVIKGTHAPVNNIYSKDLRNLIDQMLNVNPNNRPTINGILEKPFIKKRVLAYMLDNFQNYKTDEKLDISEVLILIELKVQIEILREQAEKLGIYNSMVKELSFNNEVSEKPDNKSIKENTESNSKQKSK